MEVPLELSIIMKLSHDFNFRCVCSSVYFHIFVDNFFSILPMQIVAVSRYPAKCGPAPFTQTQSELQISVGKK